VSSIQFIRLCIYNSFSDDTSSWDSVASSNWMISEYELARTWKETLVA
jgi:hypothetical protein